MRVKNGLFMKKECRETFDLVAIILPDLLTLLRSKLESLQEPQDINIQSCSHHSKDGVPHSIEADTACEPSNYVLNQGRPKRICRFQLILRTM